MRNYLAGESWQDNLALDALVAAQLKGSGSDTPTVAQMNDLVAAVMAGTCAPLRFPGALLPISIDSMLHFLYVCSHSSV